MSLEVIQVEPLINTLKVWEATLPKFLEEHWNMQPRGHFEGDHFNLVHNFRTGKSVSFRRKRSNWIKRNIAYPLVLSAFLNITECKNLKIRNNDKFSNHNRL